MNAVMKAPRVVRYAAGLMALASSAASANATDPVRWQLNMTPGVTATSQNAYDAHMIMLWICVVIGIIVFGAMAYAMFKFRHSKGAVADTNFTHSTVLEAIWTVIPIVILIGSAIPATRMVIEQYNADHNAAPAEMTIKVTGYQWMWRYEYVGQDVDFISRLDRESDRIRQEGSLPDAAVIPHYLRDVDNPLVLPADTRVRFVITADDVIHAWWVPALGWKQDAIPGVINEAWTSVKEPGTYRGVCAELCGKDHGFMPIVVKVVPKAEYAQWLAQQKAASQPAAPAVIAAPVEVPVEAAPATAPEAPAAGAAG
ncbi:MAG: cytochrome c oxidase subunit II [Arenimonas sp.]|nr:cytochrome c oxidase subunit II [Arenimonas sp.]